MPVSGSEGNRSGFINLPPRVRLNQYYNALGRYPTIKRTGDPDFSGDAPSYYDDSRTVLFVSDSSASPSQNVLVQYPTILPFGYKTVGVPLIATPNVSSSISLTRPVVQGVSDALLDFNTNNLISQSLSPFDDSRIYLSGSVFYLTGTEETVLPGFTSRLADKTQIVIDINPSEPTRVFFSTGTQANSTNPSDIGSGMAYYNFSLKRWEMIGATKEGIVTGSNVDFRNQDPQVRTGSFLGFAGAVAVDTIADGGDDYIAQNVGYPIDECGFPFATQFTASGSQLLKMSDYIQGPFLLEKVVIEWSGSFAAGATSAATFARRGPNCQQFFILNQYGNGINDNVIRNIPTVRAVLGAGSFSSPAADPVFHPVNRACDKFKELVWCGIISRYRSVMSPALCSRDLDLVGTSFVTTYPAARTGSFRLEKAPSIYSSTPARTFMRARTAVGTSFNDSFNNYEVPVLKWTAGNRGGIDRMANLSGRSVVSPVVGLQPSASIQMGSSNKNTLATSNAVQEKISPYLLLPSDNLIIGFQNIPGTDDAQGDGAGGMVGYLGFGDANLRRTDATLSPGLGKITFFGSQVLNGKEHHDTYNQPLTSLSVHESLRCTSAGNDATCLDQFEVNPYSSYAGTYMDDIYSGTIGSDSSPRVVAGRSSEGTQGSTGSLFRAVRLPDLSERYYDTLMPNLPAYFDERHLSGTAYASSDFQGTLPNKTVYYFSGAFRYEPAPVPAGSLFLAASGSLGFPYVGDPDRVLHQASLLAVSASANDDGLGIMERDQDMNAALFEVGAPREVLGRKIGLHQGGAAPGATSFISLVDERALGGSANGYRYGIFNTFPIVSSAVFRFNHYGQFRDMLEQRRYSRFFDGKSKGYPGILDAVVNIIFVDQENKPVDATQTSTQNLSQFATSSVPYFDGLAKERSGDPSDSTMIVITEVDEFTVS